MTAASLFRLLLLAAIRGGCFLPIRIGAPVIAGTALVTGFSPRRLFPRKAAAHA